MITQKQADELIKYLPTEQDKLITELAIESGLRISDILNLKAWYIDKIMYVREQKTGKHKIVEISDELYKKLLPIKKKALKNNDRENYAFTGVKNARKHYDRSTYHRHIKRAVKGLLWSCSAHSTRKLYAQNILNATGSLESVQKALNHDRILTTATYLDIDLTKLLTEVIKLGNSKSDVQPAAETAGNESAGAKNGDD